MVVSRTPKKIEHDEPLEAPFAQTFADDPPDPTTVKAKEAEDRYKLLEDELARLHEQLETRESRDLTMITQQTQVEQFVPEQLLVIPNVNEDLDGYIEAKAQNVLINDRNKRGREAFQSKTSKTLDEKVSELWADFDQDFPDYAGNRARVEFAAETVLKRAVKRGMDPNRYMFVARDRFLGDVAKEYDNIFGAPEIEEEEIEEAPRSRRGRPARAVARNNTRRRPREETDDGDIGRTAGLFGGNDSGGPRPAQREISGDAAGSMLDDIYTMQRKNGFL